VRRFAPAGADIDALAEELGEMERTRTDGIVALPGAAELLRSLPADAVAMVTSADRILAGVRMQAAGLEMPATTVTSEAVTRGKPQPEGYLRAAALLGAEPADVVVFEDAPAGIASARAAGMRTVVVGDAGGEAADGLWQIADYSAVTATASLDASGRWVIELRF
jgi:sugar-phosphatase